MWWKKLLLLLGWCLSPCLWSSLMRVYCFVPFSHMIDWWLYMESVAYTHHIGYQMLLIFLWFSLGVGRLHICTYHFWICSMISQNFCSIFNFWSFISCLNPTTKLFSHVCWTICLQNVASLSMQPWRKLMQPLTH